MIKPYEITIGSLLKTNKGEIIKVESISTKRKHRKVGYHEEGDPYHIKYVRLVQCESIPLSDEFLVNKKKPKRDNLNYTKNGKVSRKNAR